MGNSGFLAAFDLSIVIKFVNQILLSAESAAMAVFPIVKKFWIRLGIGSINIFPYAN